MKYTEVLRKRADENDPKRQTDFGIAGAGIGSLVGGSFGSGIAKAFPDFTPAERLVLVLATGVLGGGAGWTVGKHMANLSLPPMRVVVEGNPTNPANINFNLKTGIGNLFKGWSK